MVFDHEPEHSSQWGTIVSIATRIGCTPETLRKRMRQAETDTGCHGGLTSDGRARGQGVKQSEDCRHANQLQAAADSTFFRNG